MQVEISPHIEQFIEQQVRAGLFSDPSQLIAVAVERMMHPPLPDMPGWAPEELRAAVAVGIEEADRGEFAGQTMDEIFAEWQREYTDKR